MPFHRRRRYQLVFARLKQAVAACLLDATSRAQVALWLNGGPGSSDLGAVLVLRGERGFRGYQSGQHAVFSGTYIVTVFYCVYTWFILQFCGRTDWYPRNRCSHDKTSRPGSSLIGFFTENGPDSPDFSYKH